MCISWLTYPQGMGNAFKDGLGIIIELFKGLGKKLSFRDKSSPAFRFTETIRGQFFGHTHWDSFALFYENMNDPFSKPVGVLYTAPSVTTFEDLNPAYRIYTIEGDTDNTKHVSELLPLRVSTSETLKVTTKHSDFNNSFQDILDFETHFFNLSKSAKGKEPIWELLYKAKVRFLASRFSSNFHLSLFRNHTTFPIYPPPVGSI